MNHACSGCGEPHNEEGNSLASYPGHVGEEMWFGYEEINSQPTTNQSTLTVAVEPNVNSSGKARQTRFIVSHQRPLPLRSAASTVIIAFQAVTRPLLWP